MTDPVTAAAIVLAFPDLAVPAPIRHDFPPEGAWIPANKTVTGRPQTERTCSICGVVKVTVHTDSGGARREWRMAQDSVSQGEREIPCRAAAEGASP